MKAAGACHSDAGCAHCIFCARRCRLDASRIIPAQRILRLRFLSPVAQSVLELLKQRGALFFPDMVRATGRLKAEIETGLWELVAAGLVTADGFENLRALVTPKSTAGQPAMGKADRESPPSATCSRTLVAPA